MRERRGHGRREQVGVLGGGHQVRFPSALGMPPPYAVSPSDAPGPSAGARRPGELGDDRGRGHRPRRPPARAGPEREQVGSLRPGRRPAERHREVVDLRVGGGGLAVVPAQEVGLEGAGRAAGEGPGHRGAAVGRIGEGTPVGEARARLRGEQQGGADLDGVGAGGAQPRGALRGGDAARGDDRHVRLGAHGGDEVEEVAVGGLLGRVEGAAVAAAFRTLHAQPVDPGVERRPAPRRRR